MVTRVNHWLDQPTDMVLRSPAVCAGWATQPAQSCPEMRPSFEFWANTPNSRPFPQVSTLRIWSKPSRSCCPDERPCCKANFGVCWPIKRFCRHTVTTKQCHKSPNIINQEYRLPFIHRTYSLTVNNSNKNPLKSIKIHFNPLIWIFMKTHQKSIIFSIQNPSKPTWSHAAAAAAADSGSAGGLPEAPGWPGGEKTEQPIFHP